MILHELATNAAKYGALSNDEGKILIQWRTVGEDKQCVRLTWQESGGPPVVAPAHKGFGTTLIQRGLTGQLGGSAEIEFGPSGLRCTLECPRGGVPSPAT